MEVRAATRSCSEIQAMLRAGPQEDEMPDTSSDSEDDSLQSVSNRQSDRDPSNFHEFMIKEEALSDNDYELEEPLPSKRRTKSTPILVSSAQTLYGKNGYRWVSAGSKTRERQSIDDEVVHLPGARDAADRVASPIDAWSLLTPDHALNTIVRHTNVQIALNRENIEEQSYTHDVDLTELKAFIGLLYFAGVHRDGNNSTYRLWGGRSSPVYRATMFRERFAFLLRTIRFDDKVTRVKRRQVDKLAPIREIWEIFVANCKKYYTPHQYCTIGEQLLGFRGRCSFRTYTCAKADEYGMKIVMMNDAKTSYMVNALPYVGPVSTRDASESVPSYYVRTLSEPIHGTGRNLTCDDRFTGVEIAQQLKTSYSLTMVGTIDKNSGEIPEDFEKSPTVGSARFAYSNDNQILLSFSPEKNEVLLLLSTLHKSGKYDIDTGKPEIICFYNSTKGGTDTFDEMCHEYSAVRDSRRWTFRFFCGMLDQSGINSYILYSLNSQNEEMCRAVFLEELAIELVKPLLQLRLSCQTLRTSVRSIIETVLEIDSTVDNVQVERTESVKLSKRARCRFCPRNMDKKTQFACAQCRTPRCKAHWSLICSCGTGIV